MLYEYKFWHQLANPSSLTYALDNSEDGKLKGYKKSLSLVLGFTILFFVLKNIWGMNTADLTSLLVTGEVDRYSFARLISLLSAIIWGILFFVFHYYIVTYVLHLLTEIPYKWIQKIQLYVIFVIVVEKAITFIVFAIVGFGTPYTFFSIAPITAYIYFHEYLLYFLNQLTVATIVTIWIQYTFMSEWEEENKKVLLAKLILVQVLLAVIVALISILPISNWIERGLGM